MLSKESFDQCSTYVQNLLLEHKKVPEEYRNKGDIVYVTQRQKLVSEVLKEHGL